MAIFPMSPRCMRATASLNTGRARLWKSTQKLRPLRCAFCPLPRKLLLSGTSTATGLAQKTCLPASTAAATCAGWKYGGVSITTASSFDCANSRYASGPQYARPASTFSFSRVASSLLLITSAAATTRAPACSGKKGAIQLPRPPPRPRPTSTVEFARYPKTVCGFSRSAPPAVSRKRRRAVADSSAIEASGNRFFRLPNLIHDTLDFHFRLLDPIQCIPSRHLFSEYRRYDHSGFAPLRFASHSSRSEE